MTRWSLIELLGATIAVKLNHFQALKYILWTLLLFVLIGVGIGWAMYPFSH